MRKKQSPVLIGSLLIAAVGGVLFYGTMFRPMTDKELEEADAREKASVVPPVGTSREAPSKNDLLANAVKPAVGAPGGGEATGQEQDTISPVPTILRPASIENKPRPTDTDLNPQWYKKPPKKEDKTGTASG